MLLRSSGLKHIRIGIDTLCIKIARKVVSQMYRRGKRVEPGLDQWEK
jgi:hypothetical protein